MNVAAYRARAEALHAQIDAEIESMTYEQIAAAMMEARFAARAAEAAYDGSEESADAMGLARLRERRYDEAARDARPAPATAKEAYERALFEGIIEPWQW